MDGLYGKIAGPDTTYTAPVPDPYIILVIAGNGIAKVG
jgi:hypothetical protein